MGVESSDVLELTAARHPDRRVGRLGFDLRHPYVEQCWGAAIGPSAVALLRRLPVLWAEGEPARVDAGQLAQSLGLGAGAGRLGRSLDRTVRFGLAEWAAPGQALRIYTEVPPLTERRLARLPEWTQRAHGRLLAEHLDRLAVVATPGVSAITARLDRFQDQARPTRSDVPGLGQ